MHLHLYADDSQIYTSVAVSDVTSAVHCLAACIADVNKWMSASRLRFNPSKTIVQAFIACCLVWCNSLFYGVPENLLRKVQSVQNAAARLLTSARSRICDHITPLLRQLHWLPVQRRLEFKIACLAHQSLASLAPTYLTTDIDLVS